ncbi:MOSC domain-containing protein [Solimonas terrae]|uniref:MOSC domain-containing protein n=1 Tax=Solimonas terrae TaxID=1396819 RepID=A0A6M2BW87_9GAMM|nr:MOSC domain-containing protein [Solimonas terrae]NGY06758.1 MOSC domain-containing protein [Solimonas terrae]
MKTIVTQIFAGAVQAMPGDGRPTGIFKRAVDGEVEIGYEGIVCDAQADRRVHGGPEKALHHFPALNYALFVPRFPEIAAQFVPGSIGENFSTGEWREEDVCIGDVYALGSARIQLNQPRSPCWKIDARYGVDGLTKFVAEQGVAGWYYRVLAPGHCRAGDALALIERPAHPVSLREYWDLRHAHRPEPAALQRLIDTPGLAPDKREGWQQRLTWLLANPP